MKLKLFSTIVITAGMLVGCNKSEETPPGDWNGEIRLSSSVATTITRTYGIDQQIAADQKVSIYVDDTDDNKLYGKNDLKADGLGQFSEGATMYYPANGKAVDIYAIHPAVAEGSENEDFPSVPYEFAVNASQTSKTDYADSDLLYSIKTNVSPSRNVVGLTFYHLLSKVEVALRSGNGAPDLTHAIVTIEGTKLKTNFAPSKTATLDTPEGRAAMFSENENGNDATPIIIPTAVTSDNFGTGTSYAEGIIVPQTVAKNTRFIKVHLPDGGDFYYTIPNADGLELKSGYKYQFRITVNLTGLTVKSTIDDWETGETMTGDAEMPTIGSKTDLTTAAPGDFYFSDGTLEGKDAELTDEQKAACVGVVFRTGQDDTDETDYSQTGIGQSACHGYVVALKDAGEFAWMQGPNGEYSEAGTSRDRADWNGYSNQKKIEEYVSLHTSGGWTMAHFPAANACANWGKSNDSPNSTSYAAPIGSSGWFLPSAKQLAYCYNNKETTNPSLEETGGSGIDTRQYWSSTESNSFNYNAMFYSYINGGVQGEYKHRLITVRSILAF